MAGRFSAEYIDALLASAEPPLGIDLHAIITSASSFNRAGLNHGLPEALFAYVETLSWEAASFRSGVCTYYEATPENVQQQVLTALKRLAPTDIADTYGKGIFLWRSVQKAAVIDCWLASNADRVKEWAHNLAKAHRDALVEIA